MSKSNKKPFFSIIIPTFNRADDLKRAITCILRQNFEDFEIIVSDNNSKDDTEKVVKSFMSKKIVYFKNKKNIGWIPNLKMGVKIAKGRYVMFHGDDDFIIYKNTLEEIYKVIKLGNYGFIRLNFLKLSYDKKRIFDYYKKIFKNLKISPKQKSDDIVEFLNNAELNFISGLVYKNYKNAYKEIYYSELGPWFTILFKNVYKFGGYLISKHYFISTWSRGSGSFYILKNGKFKFENYYNKILKVVSKNYYKKFLERELKIMISLMPAAKLTNGLGNFLKYSKRIIYLSPKYKYSLEFWIYFLLALFIPKFVLRIIRKYKESGVKSYKIPMYNEVYKNFIEIEKL